MTSSVAFLITASRVHNDNHERLPALFQAADWQVSSFGHDDVSLAGGQIHLHTSPAAKFDLIWPIGLGPRATFLDRIGVLQQLPPGQLINPAASYVHLHGKTAWLHHAPATMVARQAELLANTFTEKGGEWVLKPAAGSLGKGVRRIQHAAQIHDHIERHPPQYWLLQEYIPDIVHGEVRTLICGGEIIGSYLRKPNADLRANLAANASAAAADLTGPDLDLVERVHAELTNAGVGFAAIDTVGGFLMEVNLANPGGLATLAEVYGPDAASAAYERLLTGAQQLAVSNGRNLRRGKESLP